MQRHLKIWNTLLIACLWLFCGVLAAEFITPAQALNTSAKWFRHFQPKASTSLKQLQAYLDSEFRPISEQQVILGDDDLPELYFVSFVDDSFAILPADDNLPPILAYSTKPHSVGASLPPPFTRLWKPMPPMFANQGSPAPQSPITKGSGNRWQPMTSPSSTARGRSIL